VKFVFNGKPRKAGIYKIINIQNERIYIGSTKKFEERAKSHFRLLKDNKHPNNFLQHDFNKCNSNVFEFHILEVVVGNKKKRRLIEQKYIDLYYDNQVQCYNFVSKVILTNSEEYSKNPQQTKRKLSKATKNSWKNPEIRKKRIKGIKKARSEIIRKQKIAWKNTPEEEKQRRSEKKRKETAANWKNPEVRKRRIEGIKKADHSKSINTNRKKWEDPDYRKKETDRLRRETLSWWKNNDEAKEKASREMKERWQNDQEFRDFFQSEDFKKKQSEYSKQLWQDEAYRKKHKESMLKVVNSKEYRRKILKVSASLISPDGKLYENIKDIPNFAKEFGLDAKCLYAVIAGKNKTHKGWRLYKK